MEKLRHQLIAYDDAVVRQMIETVRVLSSERLQICWRLGGEVEVGL
jgi:hypothetical protein